MTRYRQVSAFILAGGASSRMGQDKGLLKFGGVPLIIHTARLLKPLVRKVVLVGSPSRYSSLRLPTIDDRGNPGGGSFGSGPLAGIAAALAASHSPRTLILACDLPYLSAAWLNWLLSRAVRSRALAIVPRTERGLEPLVAVYRRECGSTIAAALARGARKVIDVIKELNPEVIHQRAWREIDPSGVVLRNMNTPRDYERARNWWGAEHGPAEETVKMLRRVPGETLRSGPHRSR